MEKTWNKLKKSFSLKISSSSSSSRSTPSHSRSSSDPPRFDVTDVNQKPRSRSKLSASTSSISRSSSKQNICAICLRNMRPGKGYAIFTAECSHSFHFNCIASNVKHGNHICPICRSTWKDVPFGNGAPASPLLGNPRTQQLRNQHPVSSEPQNFSDDEPLLQEENPPSPRSSPLSSHHQPVTTRAFPEFPAVEALESRLAFSVLVEVQAPTLAEGARPNARAPIDLVAVLDLSGSMQGRKLALLKHAVRFVIYNMGPADRLSIIAFSSSARRVFPLRRMSDTGREDAVVAVDSLTANGGTNIAEGIKKGVQVLEERRQQNPMTTIILLSDGRDNGSTCFEHDPRNPHNKVDSTSRWISYFMKLLPPSISPVNVVVTREGHRPSFPVHTFGIGVDHDATLMHAVSDVSGGTFSFIQDANIIQDAFARCIGGLLSVVAQQLRLTMKTLTPGVKISSIPSGKLLSYISNNGEQGDINVGDLYADEGKDFLVEISVPMLSEVGEVGELDPTTPLLSVECSYKDIVSKEMVKSECINVVIRRPQILSSEDTTVCLEVDRQRNRLLVVEGIAEAQALAEKGNIKDAQTILENRRLALLSSTSAQAGDSLCKWLEAELKEIRQRMSTQALYEESGRAYTLSGMSSHSCQRTTTRGDSSFTYMGDAYETPSMTNMFRISQTTISNATQPRKSSSSAQGRG